ncbi:hypothetical protein AYO38_00810 [bacterium SCGC AG-212-C10]|nr:hypothetical protein AYO38_00810 [bacterium SCGC AG-212-C10]
MFGTPAFDAFVTEHRWAVVTTVRKSGQPSSTLVAYARDGDSLIVSTMRKFAKVKMLDRDPRITVTVISNREPFNFITVEGTATIERDYAAILEPTKKVFQALAAINYKEPEDIPAWLESQGRVIVRVHPDRVYGVIR